MKKSEKIEIRISPDDKEALAKRAEAEGKPASEIVRDLLQSGGVTARAETVTMPRRSLLAAAAAGAVGIGAMIGAGAVALGTTGGEALVDLAFEVRLPIDFEADGFQTVVPLQAGATIPASRLDGATVFLPTGPQTGYRLTVAAPRGAGEAQAVRLAICEVEGEACAPLGTPELTTQISGNVTRVEAAGPGRETFTVRLIGRVEDD